MSVSIKYLVSLFALLGVSSCVGVRGVDFTQVHTGYNGPVNPGTFYFQDRDSLEKSWVRNALTAKEFVEISSKIDFERQMLLAVATGENNIANGPVVIKQIRRVGRKQNSLDVAIRIGGIESGCDNSSATSYPFALAVLPRQKEGNPYGGYSMSYFDNGCAPRKTGSPNDATP